MNENMIETMKRIQDDIFNLNDISLLFDEKFFIPVETFPKELNPKLEEAGAALIFDEKLLNGLDIIKGYLENIY